MKNGPLSVKYDSMIGRRGGKGRERSKVRQDIHLSYHRSASVPFDMLALLPGSERRYRKAGFEFVLNI